MADRERLERQIRFILEIDRLKTILRQTLLADSSKQENSAEHSWHIAVMAILLSEHARDKEIDLTRVIKMALIHDVIEIDAGDTYCYGAFDPAEKLARERKAAERIFGILPADQATELRALWEEFEERKTPEARFAGALDRLQPLLNNYTTGGLMWKKHRVKKSQAIARNHPIEDGAPDLWDYASSLIEDAFARGLLE